MSNEEDNTKELINKYKNYLGNNTIDWGAAIAGNIAGAMGGVNPLLSQAGVPITAKPSEPRATESWNSYPIEMRLDRIEEQIADVLALLKLIGAGAFNMYTRIEPKEKDEQ